MSVDWIGSLRELVVNPVAEYNIINKIMPNEFFSQADSQEKEGMTG